MFIRLYQVSNALGRYRLLPIARLVDVIRRALFAAHVPGTTEIGQGTVFGHSGLGVIINKRSVIGNNCFLGSHVVLGGQPDTDGAPTLEDDVVIHSGAKIFGPIRIGKGSVVAANAVVTRSFPARTLIGGTPARVLRENVDHLRYRPNAWRTPIEPIV